MEGEGKKEAWSIEQGQIKGDQDHEFSLPSAHTIGPGFYSLYVNWLLAAFHFNNGQMFIRYRDLMGYLYDVEKNVLLHLGFTICDPTSRKYGFHSPWWKSTEGNQLRIQSLSIEAPMVTGVTFFIFAFFIPIISAMRGWLEASTIVTFAYIAILLVVVVKDGKTNKQRDYAIHGNKSTLRKPAVTNMKKALYVQFSGGILFYWACGSKVSENLPNELSGPKWAKVLINAAVFLQSIVSQHMFVTPIHEAIDTKFLKLDKCMNTKENLKRKFFL
ncbi:unnamed protein product [Prunus armeniaca]|uniref:Amino acid transporter transmembrane domain-containing protein n=1 Tax=Prunus armeniaca TaxID=36596 RepID=A0A6J5XGJ5_PRUAR|nr:unnamed protein product [Prunus armeniaca]